MAPERLDERGVGLLGLGGEARGEGLRALPGGGDTALADRLRPALAAQPQGRLALAQQLDVDVGEQQRVDQRAVLDALGVVDAVALAQGIEAVGAGRMAAPRQDQGVDDAIEA